MQDVEPDLNAVSVFSLSILDTRLVYLYDLKINVNQRLQMATKNDMMRSLKKAMQGEMDSVTMYKSAAGYSSDPEVKEFFLSRMKEEERHYNSLLEYYNLVNEDKDLSDIENTLAFENLVDSIFSSTFIKRIGGDQVLFSAISTALLLEKNAIEFYSKCEQETENKALQSFYGVMVKWETKHYEDLVEIQKEAEEYYWQINDFQPF